MNIAIIILSFVDAVLIYCIDIAMGDVIAEVMLDVFGAAFFVLVGNHILDEKDDYEKILKLFKWELFIWLIIALVGIILSIVKKSFMDVQASFSMVIPLSIAYFILLIKNKIEEDSWRLK